VVIHLRVSRSQQIDDGAGGMSGSPVAAHNDTLDLGGGDEFVVGAVPREDLSALPRSRPRGAPSAAG
jgi:hypothetical protein